MYSNKKKPTDMTPKKNMSKVMPKGKTAKPMKTKPKK
jgi:hypothetical protein